MKGVVNESFEIENNSVQISDGPKSNKNGKAKSGITLTPKKNFLILAISVVGVLAVVGVVVGVTVPKSESQDVTPDEHKERIREAQRANVHATNYREQQSMSILASAIETLGEFDLGAETKHDALKKKTPVHHHKTKKSKNVRPNADAICTTPECAMSAASLIGAIDETADPCEDFYQFACGGWYNSHPVTDQSQGTFYEASDLVTERLHVVLTAEDAPSDPQPCKDARTHYSTCLDTDTMDSLGVDPLWTQLSSPEQSGWPLVMDSYDDSKFLLEEALVFISKIEVNPIIALGISSDFLDTSHNILYMTEGGLGLSSTYLLDAATYEAEIGYYKTYITETAKLIRDGIGSTVTNAAIALEVDDIVNFEIELAKTYQFIPTDPRDVLEKVNISYLQAVTDSVTPGQFHWLTYFRILFSGTDVVIDSDEPIYIAGEPFFPKFSTLLSTTSSRTLANYIGWWWVMTSGDATTYAMRNVTLQYRNSMFGSTSLYSSRESHCQIQTQYNLGMPTSRLYVDSYFPVETRPEVALLVELIRASFSTIIADNTWMTAGDIADSQEKLAAIEDRVAYPDWIMDNAELTLAFNTLTIVAGEQYDNLIRMADFFNFWTLERFRSPPKNGWPLPPTVVNAFYDPLSNSISILAAILQPPFYTHNSLAALNYGAIGMVIGHEFTHGFDDSGRHFDKDGNYANWWDEQSITNFKDRSQCFVDQYDNYSPPDLQGTPYSNMTVNGKQTLGENIADNGGIREAFQAYLAYVSQFGEEPLLPGLETYNPYQLFFIGYANVWCEHKITNDIVRQLNTDPHSPGRFRVIGPLSNDDNFRTTWSCGAGTAMNRGNESCLLW